MADSIDCDDLKRRLQAELEQWQSGVDPAELDALADLITGIVGATVDKAVAAVAELGREREGQCCDTCLWVWYDRHMGLHVRCRSDWATHSLRETGKLPLVPASHRCHDWVSRDAKHAGQDGEQ